jgi:uncharacterized protein (DUF58 family)
MKSSPVGTRVLLNGGDRFADVREYQIGDDFRSTGCNVAARFGGPYIKFSRKKNNSL